MSDPIEDMLRFDPLSEAEKVTGLSYKEDEGTMALGFAAAMEHNAVKQAALTVLGDSHFGMSWGEMVAILEDLGFECIYTRHFDDNSYGESHRNSFLVWWRNGILVKTESYATVRVNTAQMYYNWEPSNDVESVWGYTSSGSFHRPSYDAGRKVWIGDHDVREGFRHKLRRLEANGSFVNPWVGRSFLWLLDYTETRVEGYDYKALTEGVISQLPLDVQRAITPEVSP